MVLNFSHEKIYSLVVSSDFLNNFSPHMLNKNQELSIAMIQLPFANSKRCIRVRIKKLKHINEADNDLVKRMNINGITQILKVENIPI